MKLTLALTAVALISPMIVFAGVTPNTAITLSEVSVVHTNKNHFVTVRVLSSDPKVRISALEYFLDSTNDVINGRGISMLAQDGRFDSTNEVAAVTFKPRFRKGLPREMFIHARGSDLKWTSFVETTLTP